MKATRHSKVELWIHLAWATSGRQRLLGEGFWACAAGIAERAADRERVEVRAVGGYEDHAHVLVRIRPDVLVSEVARKIKGAWSHWLRREGGVPGFRWQEGYGAFSVSPGRVRGVAQYVATQRERHAVGDWEEGMEPG